MNEYKINKNTVAIIPISKTESKILELEKEFIIKKSVKNLIDESCIFFGSSYKGRLKGTKALININYKSPIIIEESSEIIFFPTSSPRFENCIWLSLENIKDYKKNKYNNSTIIFKNNRLLKLELSYYSLNNQILRSIKLNMVLKKRKLFQK